MKYIILLTYVILGLGRVCEQVEDCQMDKQLVCGLMSDGQVEISMIYEQRQEFVDRCQACQNSKVIQYEYGNCEDGANEQYEQHMIVQETPILVLNRELFVALFLAVISSAYGYYFVWK